MRIAIVLLVLALAGLVAWWSFGDANAPPPPPPTEAADTDTPRANEAESQTARPEDAVAAEASIDRATFDAAESEHGLPPPPDDAHWIELTVIERESQEPVPFAKVMWANERQQERLKDLPYLERQRYEIRYWLPAEEFGYRALTDANGKVRVWCEKKSLRVVAKSEGNYGFATLQVHEQKTEHTLEIAMDRTLLVHVVTPDDEDARGAQVGLGQLGEKREPGRFSYSSQLRRTDAKGIATFEHVQMLQRWQWGAKQGQPVPKLMLKLHQPGGTNETSTIDAQDLPDEPVELRLGPSGHLRVRPLVAGAPYPPRWGMRIWDKSSREGSFMAWRNALAPDEDGWVEVRHVALGKTFQVGSGSWSSDVAGPTVDGETVSHEIELCDTRCVLTANLLAADGQPVRNKSVIGEYGPPKDRDTLWGQTDDDGKVTWMMAPPKDGKPRMLELLTVRWEPKDDAIQQQDVGSVTLPLGLTELGEITLEKTVAVLSGRIEADCGSDMKASCSIQRYVVYSDPKREPRWRSVDSVKVKVADDLTFQAYGKLPPDRYRITLYGEAFAPFDPVEFAPGATDLVLRPRCGHKLTARTILPEGMKGNALQVVLKSTGATQRSHWGQLRESLESVAEHDWKGLAPGLYRIEVNLENQRRRKESLLTLENVQVPRDDGSPVELDLRSKLTTLRLTLDVNAEIAPGQYLVFPPPADPDRWYGTNAPHGPSVLPVPQGTHEITVAAEGYRARTVPVQGTEVAITLEPWPEASVTVSGLQGLPEGMSARMNARPIQDGGKDARRYHASWNSGNVADLLFGGRANKRLEDKPVTFPFGTRRMAVTLTVSAKYPYRSVQLKDFSPKELTSAGSHVITVSPGEIDRVLAEMRRQKEERNKKRKKRQR